MIPSKGDTRSPRRCFLLVVTLCLFPLCHGGPLGPLPNETYHMGLKQESCAVGDVVYLPGDEFPGSEPCERCRCAPGGVHCEHLQCEPRPGCKALHRPDHCCPTYQCECEKEGRVYGNGEKLVDPQEPCSVCYCQGGEVVCRRIACFVRNDCTPRVVPERCCPEYDNCPVRGVTSLPGMTSLPPSPSPIEKVESSIPKEKIKQEITIKEITPVSEIPVITEVKIKEILPSQSIEVSEYSSSKSPLIPREATSEKPFKIEEVVKTEAPTVVEIHPVSPTQITQVSNENQNTADSLPSKISLSTQDSINSDIYPSNIPSVVTMGVPNTPDSPSVATTTRSPLIEEEDQPLDHNPAFPPLPDDLLVLSNHGDEIVPEPSADTDHVHEMHDIISPTVTSTEAKIEEILTTTLGPLPTHLDQSTKDKFQESQAKFSTPTSFMKDISSTESTVPRGSPKISLRSAIPTVEIINVSSYVPEKSTAEIIESVATEKSHVITSSTVKSLVTEVSDATTNVPLEEKSNTINLSTTVVPITETTALRGVEVTAAESSSKILHVQNPSPVPKSNLPTEVTSQTELSSLPIETSDQNPHESENTNDLSDIVTSTANPLNANSKVVPTDSEIITVSRAIPNEDSSFENIETTEFVLTSFGSSESATDNVELLKISGDPDKSAAIIDGPEEKKDNVLTDLINLVSDVASISDHTESPRTVTQVSGSTSISDSEELIPVNAGYKSKSNSNQNSITEIPIKAKNTVTSNKQKVIEIEDDDSAAITDSPPPNDNVEPTTRLPIIDNVSDNKSENKTEKKDIEIITQSYVPTINRRPTKVVMKKTNDAPDSHEDSVTAISINVSDSSAPSSTSEPVINKDAFISTEVPFSTEDSPHANMDHVSKDAIFEGSTVSFVAPASTESSIVTDAPIPSTDITEPNILSAVTSSPVASVITTDSGFELKSISNATASATQ